MTSVLHVIPTMNPAHGGPVTAVKDLVVATARHGCRSEIVSLDDSRAVWLKGLVCPVTPCGEGKHPFRASRRLRNWMIGNAGRFDCAIVHGLWLYPTRCAADVHRQTGLPFAVYAHGMLDIAHRKLFPIRHIKKSIWWAASEHRALSRASAIFFTSETEKELAASTFRPRLALDRARIVPYCVEPPPAEPERQCEAFYQQFPTIRNKRLILFMSRIHPKKGIELLLDAFRAAAKVDSSLHLMIAGTGDAGYERTLRHSDALRDLANRTTWPGLLQNDLKWGALRSAELLCLPSFQENFGIIIAEALACSTPVMITDRVNIASVVSAAGAGIVTACTRDEVSAALRNWVSSPAGERAVMRSRAIECFREEFASDHAALTFLEVLPRRDGAANVNVQQVRGAVPVRS